MGVLSRITVASVALAWGTWGFAAEVPADFNLNAIDTTEESVAWFPDRAGDSAGRPPAQRDALEVSDPSAARDPALIPLPPAAWTGMAGLIALTLPGIRRYLLHIVR